MPDSLIYLDSSRLLRTKVIRDLRRDDRSLTDGTPLLDRVGMLAGSRETHTVAGSIERHVRTPDSLHLATALLIGAPGTVATHDETMKTVAGHLGLNVTDPSSSHPLAATSRAPRAGGRPARRRR